jgi:hypothetical protein
MDWARHDFTSGRLRAEPRLELVQTFWCFVGPSRRPITCAVYRTDAGLELRAGRSAEDLIRSQRVQTTDGAAVLADQWKQALVAAGLTELPIPDSS